MSLRAAESGEAISKFKVLFVTFAAFVDGIASAATWASLSTSLSPPRNDTRK